MLNIITDFKSGLSSGHWRRLLENSSEVAQPRVEDRLSIEDCYTEVLQILSVPMFDFKSIRFIWSHAGFSLMFVEVLDFQNIAIGFSRQKARGQ